MDMKHSDQLNQPMARKEYSYPATRKREATEKFMKEGISIVPAILKDLMT